MSIDKEINEENWSEEEKELDSIFESMLAAEGDEDDFIEIPELEEDITESDEVIESDEVDEDEEEVESPVKKKNRFNNHRLKYDSILKGKKHDVNADEFSQDFLVPKQTSFDLIDHNNSEDSFRICELEEIIFEFVKDKTTVDITAPRRKPGKVEFNKYMLALCSYIDTSLYSYGEIFTVFSVYFSDNLFSMFKLLDKKIGAVVAKELNIIIENKDFDQFEVV